MTRSLNQFIRVLTAIVFIAFQQGFVILMGLLLLDVNRPVLAFMVWACCLPMIYINVKTYRLLMKYGFVNFITMNADTSEIDVPQGQRWYDQ